MKDWVWLEDICRRAFFRVGVLEVVLETGDFQKLIACIKDLRSALEYYYPTDEEFLKQVGSSDIPKALSALTKWAMGGREI